MASRLQPDSTATEEEDRSSSSESALRRWTDFEQQRGDFASRQSGGSDPPRSSASRFQGRDASADKLVTYEGLVSRDHDRANARQHSRARVATAAGGIGYDEPGDYQNLGAISADQPTSTPKDPSRSERALRKESSRIRPNRAQGRGSGRQIGEGLTETAAAPPITTSSNEPNPLSSAKQQEGLEPESDDAEPESAPAPNVRQRFQRNSHQYDSRATGKQTTRSVPNWLTGLYTISYLIFFAILGTLARLGMQWLTFYPGAPIVTPVVWANFAGSVFMGFLAEDQGLFHEYFITKDPERRESTQTEAAEREERKKVESAKTKKTIPLYIGLATGFCGSFTSFSSFARDFFLALSNNLPTPVDHPRSAASTTLIALRNGGYSFEAWAAVVFFTLALSLGGLIVGAHIALFVGPYTPRVSQTITGRLLDPLMIFMGWGCWLGAVFLCIWPPDRPSGPASQGSWSNETWRGEVLFALVFAPVGCLLRFYASLLLNPIVSTFPLGTFAVNMFGTAIEGMCYDIQHVGVGTFERVGGGRVGCQVLQGVMDGFCGCLTTVSTWVAEINGLRRSHAWRYAFASVVGALCLMVIIMGSVRWTVGLESPACNTGYPNKIHG